MYNMPTRAEVERIKKEYPIGTVLEMCSMQDSYNQIPIGTHGEVVNVDDIGTLHMNWSNGSTLGVIVGEDRFKVISRPELESQGMQMQ